MTPAGYALILGGMLGFVLGVVAGWTLALNHVNDALEKITRELIADVTIDDIKKLADTFGTKK